MSRFLGIYYENIFLSDLFYVFSALIKLMHEGVASEMSAARCLELVMKVQFSYIYDSHSNCFF